MGVAEKNPIQAGARYGSLVVISFIETRKQCGTSQHYWRCLCDCGKFTVTRAAYLKNGHTKSCGCFVSELSAAMWFKPTHGESRKTMEYKTWQSMKDRCYNPKNRKYKDYGGRGIRVCDEWRNSYVAFLEYLLATIGRRPKGGYSIDRIDNNRGYEAGNIRWATSTEQNNNRRPFRNSMSSSKSKCTA